MPSISSVVLISSLVIPQAPPPEVIDQDAYAVLGTVIRTQWPARSQNGQPLLIQDATDPSVIVRCQPDGKAIKAAWADALTSLRSEGVSAHPLRPRLQLDRPYELLPRASLMGFFEQSGPNGWSAFYAAHPNTAGFLRLSAVGFDKDKTHALAYVSLSCGMKCGESAYHFLEKREGVWREVTLEGVNLCWVVS